MDFLFLLIMCNAETVGMATLHARDVTVCSDCATGMEDSESHILNGSTRCDIVFHTAILLFTINKNCLKY